MSQHPHDGFFVALPRFQGMTSDQVADRHLSTVMGYLGAGRWEVADMYMVVILKRESRSMYEAVSRLIAERCRIAPLDQH